MITDDFYYHTIILVVIRPVKPVKPGLAGHNRPKPSEALGTGSGFKLYRPEASQSWAVDPAFRPSRAGKSLLLTNQRQDKLAAARVDFEHREMLRGLVLTEASARAGTLGTSLLTYIYEAELNLNRSQPR